MARLSGDFSVLMLVTMPEASPSRVRAKGLFRCGTMTPPLVLCLSLSSPPGLSACLFIPSQAEQIRSKLMEVEGMQVSTRWADPPQHSHHSGRSGCGAGAAPGRLTRLSLRGPDMPGIAYTVA